MKQKTKVRRTLLIVFSLIILIAVSLLFGSQHLLIKYNYLSGTSKQKLKDYDGAIISYSQVLEYDSLYTAAYISRGSAYLDLKKHNNAIADYTKAIGIAPDNAPAFAYRGRAYYEIKDSIRSLNDLDKAVSLDNKFAYAYYQRGLLKYTLFRQYPEGCADLKAALELGMSEARSLLENGGCY